MKILISIFLFTINSLIAQSFYEYVFHPIDFNAHNFGQVVIQNDSMIFISAHSPALFGYYPGSLYYYKKDRDTIRLKARIVASDGSHGDSFGIPYLFGDRLYVSSIKNFFEKIYEYKYDNGNWIEINQIKPPRDSIYFGHGAGFASSCVRSNNELFVGACFDYRFKTGGGTVYHYELQDTLWKLRRVMFPKYIASDANFGYYLSFNYEKNLLFISAPFDSNDYGRYSGNVYIYEKVDSMWQVYQILSPTEGDLFQGFGVSISTKDDYLFIGAPGGAFSNSGGVVYIYRYINNQWQYRNKIISPINHRRDYFGYSISFYKGKLLVGAPGEAADGQRRSFAYLYNIVGDSAYFLFRFQPTNSDILDNFGISVSAIDNEYLIGAYEKSNNGYDTGGAFLFSLKPLSNFDKEIQINDFVLYQNYPNPFNPSTKICWQAPVSGHTTIKVYDVLGREVAKLLDEYKEAGYHEVSVSSRQLAVGNTVASGVYFYKLKVGEFVQTKKMILAK